MIQISETRRSIRHKSHPSKIITPRLWVLIILIIMNITAIHRMFSQESLLAIRISSNPLILSKTSYSNKNSLKTVSTFGYSTPDHGSKDLSGGVLPHPQLRGEDNRVDPQASDASGHLASPSSRMPPPSSVPGSVDSQPRIKSAHLKPRAVVSRGDVHPLEALPSPKIAPPIPYTEQDLRLLAQVVHAEAGTQPFVGQVAVAAVVINRMKAPGFPKTIAQVIQEPGQFTSVTNGSIWQPADSTAYLAAAAALKGWDPTHGALYFYNPSLPFNHWMNTLPITASIAGQLFCR